MALLSISQLVRLCDHQCIVVPKLVDCRLDSTASSSPMLCTHPNFDFHPESLTHVWVGGDVVLPTRRQIGDETVDCSSGAVAVSSALDMPPGLKRVSMLCTRKDHQDHFSSLSQMLQNVKNIALHRI